MYLRGVEAQGQSLSSDAGWGEYQDHLEQEAHRDDDSRQGHQACAGLVITLLEYFRNSKMSRLIAANQTLKASYPHGYPEGLLVRGLGQAMEAALDKLGDKREDELTGHVVLVTDTVTREILGPKFCLRGPSVTIGFRPKQLWGEGTKVI